MATRLMSGWYAGAWPNNDCSTRMRLLKYINDNFKSRQMVNKTLHIYSVLQKVMSVSSIGWAGRRLKRRSQYDCDMTATATIKQTVRRHATSCDFLFTIVTATITMQESVWAWPTSCGVIVYCYFYVLGIINKDNLLFAVIFHLITSTSYVTELE